VEVVGELEAFDAAAIVSVVAVRARFLRAELSLSLSVEAAANSAVGVRARGDAAAEAAVDSAEADEEGRASAVVDEDDSVESMDLDDEAAETDEGANEECKSTGFVSAWLDSVEDEACEVTAEEEAIGLFLEREDKEDELVVEVLGEATEVGSEATEGTCSVLTVTVRRKEEAEEEEIEEEGERAGVVEDASMAVV
jgi:hypothetical protein